MTDIQQVADALEAARSRFHGLAAALKGHLDGHCTVDLKKVADLLQEGNCDASAVLQELYASGQWTAPWDKRDSLQ